MIKINLLDCVTDRTKSVAVVEARVTDPRTRSMILLGAVGAILILGIAVDWISANSARSTAQAELQRQEQIKAQMEAVNKELTDLEKKTKEIELRIETIKKLRASQQGPVAVLSAINQRLPAIADFRLETIEQKEGELIVEGDSPNEAAVTQFGRSLEFSSGLFTNVNIETERRTMEVAYTEDRAPAQRPETIRFKIKCKYTEPGAPASAAPPGSLQPAAASPQIAQK